jgi:hypothetical protein
MTFSQLIIDIQSICKLFNLGELSGYETHKYSIAGYEVAKFTTSSGNYEYIFKS